MDSGNILSILASLNGGNSAPAGPSNVMQTLAQDPQQPYYNPAPAQAPPPQPLAPPQTFTPPSDAAPVAAPKRRRSLLDIIGSAADVIAKVGGAQALYQPSLDAREDRSLALGDHARKMAAEDLKSATDKFALGDSQNSRVGQVARGVKAIMAGNPNADPATLWPALARQMQLDPATTQSIGQAIATQGPGVLDGLITGTQDPKTDESKYSGNVVYAKDENGQLHAFQINKAGGDARDALPSNMTPVEPLQFVNQGDQQAGFGKYSGAPQGAIPIHVSPDTRMTTGERADEFHYTQGQKTQERDDKKTADNLQKFSVFDTARSTLSGLDNGLNDLITDPNLSEATGLVNGKLNLTDGQRTIDAKIENLVNQSIGPAIAVIKQSGGAAPRAVSEIMGEAQALLGAVKNRTAPTAAYIANVRAASQRLRQRIQLAENAAVREGYAVRGEHGFEPAPAVNSTSPSRKPASEKPTPRTGGSQPKGIITVNSPAEAAKLPKGAHFRTPDGRLLVRK